MGHHRGLVALAPQWYGRQERSIRFEQDAVRRGKLGGSANRLRFRIGKVSGKREMKSSGERALGLFDRAGEAVHDAAKPGRRPVFSDQAQQILPGVGRAELLLRLGVASSLVRQ